MAVSDFNNVLFKAFPNPLSDILHLNSEVNIHLIKVFDLAGRKLSSANTDGSNITIDFSAFQSGTYIVKAHSDSGNATVKILKR